MPLASSGVGIAVKAGAPKPDISTPEALKQTLLDAKSIAYSEPSAGGASGVYFEKLLERMGIAARDAAEDQISAGGRLLRRRFSSPARPNSPCSKSRNCCMSPAVEIVGMLPGDLNLVTAFAAGLMPDVEDAGRQQP